METVGRDGLFDLPGGRVKMNPFEVGEVDSASTLFSIPYKMVVFIAIRYESFIR